jgi:gamma-glutamyltranspeptidase / glutathione hydrolase
VQTRAELGKVSSMRTASTLLAALVLLVALGADGASEGHVGRYTTYAVATDHPEASRAGASVFEAGGNAADAAAAAMLALGVASPASSGFFGGGFALYYRASDRSFTFLDFRERAPLAAGPDFFVGRAPAGEGSLSEASQRGGLASGVPGEPAGIAELVTRFGKLPLDQVAAPAVALARRGVRVSPNLARLGAAFGEQMKADEIMNGWITRTRGFRAGAILRQPRLADTLEAFGRDGADLVYRGALADAIVEANRKAGGVFTREDLEGYRVVTRKPLVGRYFGRTFVTAPPPSAGGYTLLQSLAILERVDPKLTRGRFERLHALAESWKGPYLDRQRYFGDPDHVELPLAAMMDPARIAARASLVQRDAVTPPARFDFPLEVPEGATIQPDGGGTSHLCVVDAEGNVAAVTTTVNLPFGARYTAAGAVMNDEMDDFARAVGEVNAFRLIGGERNLPGPGKRPVSTMTPTIVLEGDAPVLCVGASGGSRIVTATEQVAMNVLFDGLDLGWAVSRARIHHQGSPDSIGVETFAPLPPEAVRYLETLGHRVETLSYSANVQAIEIREGARTRLVAASDPRKGGAPAGK